LQRTKERVIQSRSTNYAVDLSFQLVIDGSFALKFQSGQNLFQRSLASSKDATIGRKFHLAQAFFPLR
jgi:hypothetical protein